MMLNGKKGLITGIANEDSIAYYVAKSCVEAGADIAITYQNKKTKKFTEKIAKGLNSKLYLPCDVTEEDSLEDLFKNISNEFGKIDFILHSMAFANSQDLHGRVVDCSEEGFLKSMNVSCYSFIKMAKLAEPLMVDAGSLVTMSYLGSERVVPNYGIMGVVKAALESSTRYLAVDLGEKGIRVNCVSPGAVMTRAASGIQNFNQLIEENKMKSPLKSLTKKEDVADLVKFLFSDSSKSITGSLMYVDAGYNIMA